MSDLFRRLRERKLGQWALAYAAAAWVALQVLGFLASAYGWPTSAVRIGTGVAITGFPVVLVRKAVVRGMCNIARWRWYVATKLPE